MEEALLVRMIVEYFEVPEKEAWNFITDYRIKLYEHRKRNIPKKKRKTF